MRLHCEIQSRQTQTTPNKKIWAEVVAMHSRACKEAPGFYTSTGNATFHLYGNHSYHSIKWLAMAAVPFFLILSFWGMVSGQLHGFSFSTQKSPAVSNTGYNQFNTISQQGYRGSSPRGQEACYKYHKTEYRLAAEVLGYGIFTKNKTEACDLRLAHTVLI